MKESVEKYLTIDELAKRWDMAAGTLAHWRMRGKGPKFQKIGNRVRYPLTEVVRCEKRLFTHAERGVV